MTPPPPNVNLLLIKYLVPAFLVSGIENLILLKVREVALFVVKVLIHLGFEIPSTGLQPCFWVLKEDVYFCYCAGVLGMV